MAGHKHQLQSERFTDDEIIVLAKMVQQVGPGNAHQWMSVARKYNRFYRDRPHQRRTLAQLHKQFNKSLNKIAQRPRGIH